LVDLRVQAIKEGVRTLATVGDLPGPNVDARDRFRIAPLRRANGWE
jgi:hypothetical protein